MQTKEKLQKSDIISEYISGCKKSNTIGMEYERLPIQSKTYRAVDYWSDYGVCNFLRSYAKEENWDYILDDYNIIGLKQGHDTLTLEPGCQIELSIKPEQTVRDLKNKIEKLDSQMKPILDKYGMYLLNYGISPLSVHKNIKLIPKRRYSKMAKYLWGILSDVMMRETAGIQCCVDFESEEDAMRKFRIANKLTPFMTAMFANSPIRGGVDTGYKSFRALSWLNTDNDRCGFVGRIDDMKCFEDYVDYVLETPVIFINKNEELLEINGKMNFNQMLRNGIYDLDINDYNLAANLYFPEVRLRSFIEVRNQDCVGKGLQYSIPAVYKGVMYDGLSDTEELLKQFEYRDYSELRYNVPKLALQSKIGKYEVKDIAVEILKIAERSLISQNSGDEKFLEPIKEYTYSGLCPADIIIRNWNGIWNKDICKLISFLNS